MLFPSRGRRESCERGSYGFALERPCEPLCGLLESLPISTVIVKDSLAQIAPADTAIGRPSATAERYQPACQVIPPPVLGPFEVICANGPGGGITWKPPAGQGTKRPRRPCCHGF